jgi:hypothetical protein
MKTSLESTDKYYRRTLEGLGLHSYTTVRLEVEDLALDSWIPARLRLRLRHETSACRAPSLLPPSSYGFVTQKRL